MKAITVLLSVWGRGVVALVLMSVAAGLAALFTAPFGILAGWFVLDALGYEGASWLSRWEAGAFLWAPIVALMVFQSIVTGKKAQALILRPSQSPGGPTYRKPSSREAPPA